MNKMRRVAPVLIAVVLGITAASWACSTPVYRYAIYRWKRAPYEVFYLHDGKTAPQDVAVNKALAAISPDRPGEGKTANLRFTTLDVSDKAVLAALPPELQQTLKKHKDQPLPWHVVYTPGWTELHVGRLDKKTMKTLVDSPARKKMNELLSGGAPCVLVLVPGKDEAVNKLAREHIATTIKNAAKGKFTPPKDPLEEQIESPGGAKPGDTKPDKAKEKPKLPGVATITVKRDDLQEQWLMRCLMRAENDLQQFVGEAMVFAVYGRARVMPPCIGKGITAENLGDYVVFSMGPCSCEVKDQNPGMDLLSQWDWEKSAAAMAELFGNETGNESLLQTDEFLQLLLTPPANIGPSKDAKPKRRPKGGVDRGQSLKTGSTKTGSRKSTSTESKPTATKPSLSKPQGSVQTRPTAGVRYADASDPAPLVKSGPIDSTDHPNAGSDASTPTRRVLRNVAIASTGAVAALLIVGFLFLRPRSA